MPDPDVLEKAAEALRTWLERTFCDSCGDKKPCVKRGPRRSWCSVELAKAWAKEPARAVLEAAGIEALCTIAENARALVRLHCDACPDRPNCGSCGWRTFADCCTTARTRGPVPADGRFEHTATAESEALKNALGAT